MLASNLELLHHIQDEVNFILDATSGKDKTSVINDPVLSRAIIRSLEIIGEAAKKIDDELKVNSRISNGKRWQVQGINLYMIISVSTTT
jgi:uncharacterized protein with HEPN domain